MLNDFQLYIGVSIRFYRELDAVLAQLGEGVKEDWLDVMSKEFRLFFYTDTGRLAMYVPETVPSYTVTLTIVLERMRGAFRRISKDKLIRLITFALDERMLCHKYPDVAIDIATTWYKRFLFALMDSHHGSYYMGYSSEELHTKLIQQVKIFEAVVAAFKAHAMDATDRRVRMLHSWIRHVNNESHGASVFRLRDLIRQPSVLFDIMDRIHDVTSVMFATPSDDPLSNLLLGWLNEDLFEPAGDAEECDLALLWDMYGMRGADCPFSEPHIKATLDGIRSWKAAYTCSSFPLTWLWQHSETFYGKPMELEAVAKDILRAAKKPKDTKELEEKLNAGTV